MRMLITGVATAVAAITFLATTPASAAHDTPLYQVACEFREAVSEFERAVIRSRYFDHYQERLVDRLEDASSSLRSAARHPDRVERLLSEWRGIEVLHAQVEQMMFSHPPCASSRELVVIWGRVTCAYTEIAAQLAPICLPTYAPAVVRHHVQSFRVPVCPDLDFCPNDPRSFFQIPGAPVPNYGVPNPIPNYPVPSLQPDAPLAPHYQSPAPYQYSVPDQVPGELAPGVDQQNPIPGPAIPERVIPDRPLRNPYIPEGDQAEPDILPGSYPSNWQSNSEFQRHQQRAPASYWNAGRLSPNRVISRPSYARYYSPTQLQMAEAERHLDRTESYGRANAAAVGALISRLIE